MIIFLLSFLFSTAEASTPYQCQTKYDQLNIPHVETSSMEGFYYCFGLQHGRDRAWEMDFFRRVGQGRNAEIHGFSQLKSDLMMRLLDLPETADRLWNEFPTDKRKWLELYSDGVNEGFKTGKMAREFLDKDYGPEAWEPKHTILILLLQSFDQTRKTFFRDYEEEKIKEKWGKEAPQLFDEDKMPWENTILKKGEYPEGEVKVSQTNFGRAVNLWSEFPYVFGKEESGSNNWAVSAKKSKTGHALFANDPHLDLKTPLFWYWMNLKTPDLKVVGGSVPGVPVMASGTNGKVAWGLTNSYLNAADAVFVKDLKKEDIVTFRPTVYIKFWIFRIPFFFKSFEKLKTGHRILPLEIDSDEKMALRWTGFSLKADEVFSMFDMAKMQNVKEMDQLIKQVGVPSWNFVFADSKGEIGFRLVGKTYKHTEKLPFGIPVMSLEEFLKEEFLSPEERPHVMNPKRNYIYTANNRHWPSDAKYYGGRGYSYAFRGLRIDEMLQSRQDLESFKKIQCDTQVVDARFFVPKLLNHLSIPEFNGWQFTAEGSSKAVPVYRRLMDIIFEKWNVNEYALYKMLDNLNSEKKNDLKKFYDLAIADVKGKTWNEFHLVKFPHMAGSQWIFSPEISGVGDTHSVNPGTARWNSDRKLYEQFSGASMRLIVELKETPVVHLTLPGLNREYDKKKDNSAWESWRDCVYTRVEF